MVWGMGAAKENRYRRMIDRDWQARNRRRMDQEAMMISREPRPARRDAPKGDGVTKREIVRWMRIHASEYEDETRLCEAANAIFRIPGLGLDDETHWIWEEAFKAFKLVEH